tara:strand:+ start:108 stop:335 length:228 start_codon:yes stop_codon:yes gene_type:complete
MKTVDEILDLADSYAENPCQAICDALYKNEDEARDKILELETELADLKKSIGHAVRIPYADRLRLLAYGITKDLW